MWIDIVFVMLGIIFLALGGDALIRGALSISKRFGVSALISGLVIVGFGTSMPELVVSIQAVVSEQPAIAIGNVVGSNIGNILLILALCGLIMPMTAQKTALARDAVMMLLASLLLTIFMLDGLLSRGEGVVFLVLLVSYLLLTYQQEKKGAASLVLHTQEAEEIQSLPEKTVVSVGFILLGLVGLIAGAQLLVIGAVNLAQDFGVSEALIGLTVVAIGTSLPELTVSVIAALRKHADVAIGNILGSNIFNILGILGVSALLTNLPVVDRIRSFDQWYMLGAAVLLFIFLWTGRKLNRSESAVLLASYGLYLYLSVRVFN